MNNDMQAIIFDFDGVILDSMPVRTHGFREIFKDFPTEQVDALVAYHLANGGLSRFAKIRYFFDTLLGTPITHAEVMEYATSFSEIMRKNLIDHRLIIEPTVAYMQRCSKKLFLHIASGSEENELKHICTALQLSQYFRSIHGSPTPKTELLSQILEKNGYTPEKVVFIGDSHNDFEAADANGTRFWGFNNSDLKGIGEHYIEDMKLQTC